MIVYGHISLLSIENCSVVREYLSPPHTYVISNQNRNNQGEEFI